MNSIAAAATAAAKVFDTPVFGMSAPTKQQAPVPAPLVAGCGAGSYAEACSAKAGPEFERLAAAAKLVAMRAVGEKAQVTFSQSGSTLTSPSVSDDLPSKVGPGRARR